MDSDSDVPNALLSLWTSFTLNLDVHIASPNSDSSCHVARAEGVLDTGILRSLTVGEALTHLPELPCDMEESLREIERSHAVFPS